MIASASLRNLLRGLAIVGGMELAIDAGAATYVVTANPDMTFTPASLTIHQGDSVRFENAGGLHNVIADNGSFHCGFNCNTNWAPSTRAWAYTFPFNDIGTFGHYCEQHGDLSSGMRVTVIVIDRVFVDGFDDSPPAALAYN